MGWPGVPGTGNGASFMGWGGPARGNAGDRPPQPRTAADAQRSSEISRDPVKMAEIERRKRSREERAAVLTEFFEDIALDVERYGFALRVNIEEGRPVARIETPAVKVPESPT